MVLQMVVAIIITLSLLSLYIYYQLLLSISYKMENEALYPFIFN